MDMAGLLMLLLLAQSTRSLNLSRTYHFVNQLKNWTEAQSYCRENFDDLATIEFGEDWEAVREMVLSAGDIFAWIGMREGVGSWRWSLDDTPLGTNLGTWFVFQENNHAGDEYCVYYSSRHHELMDGACRLELKSVCYDEPSNTYITVWKSMSWPAAQSHCRQEYSGLASMKTEQEKSNIRAKVDGVSRFWIGLTKTAQTWSDQSPSLFVRWTPGSPNTTSNCVGASQYGFADTSCADNRKFICSTRRSKTIVKVVLGGLGSVDTNDRQFQDAVLNHIKNQLKNNGIDEALQLTWRK